MKKNDMAALAARSLATWLLVNKVVKAEGVKAWAIGFATFVALGYVTRGRS